MGFKLCDRHTIKKIKKADPDIEYTNDLSPDHYSKSLLDKVENDVDDWILYSINGF